MLDDTVGSLALSLNEEFVIALKHFPEAGDGDFFNHSCNPNAGINGQIFLVAMREIEPGEEITFDYAFCELDKPPFKCHCGSQNCRKIIKPLDWKLPRLQRKYGKYFSPFVKEKFR